MVMRKSDIKVTVIMPSLNVVHYIRECIESVIHQTLKEIEIVCVDAGSTDGTLEILQEYARQDARIRIIISDRKSYGYQMNLGMDAARGDYIGIVETDDFVASEMFEKLYDAAINNSLDLVKSNFNKVDKKNPKGVLYNILNDDPTRQCDYNIVFTPVQKPGIFCIQPSICTALYRRNFIIDNEIRFNETPGASYQDVGFAFKTLYFAKRIMILDRAYHYYRTDNDNSSSNSSAKIFCITDEYDSIENFLIKNKENRAKILPFLVRRKFASYLWTYNRVAPQFQKAFYLRMINEYKKYWKGGLIYLNLYSNYLKKQLLWMIRDSDGYFRSTSKLYQINLKNNGYIYPHEGKFHINGNLKIIVSLTSYPLRIKQAVKAVQSLLNQTMKADMVILWLAKEQFPNGESDLPVELLAEKENGLTIRWCDRDLKSHKKFFYAMQEFPEDIIITADDDLIYDSKTIEILYQSYLEFPNCVSALRCHLPIFDENGNLSEYSKWKMGYSNMIGIPSMMLFSTSGGGTLYPPHCMHKEVFNVDALMKCCPYADDVWLKFMQVMQNTPTVLTRPDRPLHYIPNTQKEALWHDNLEKGGNDKQIKKTLEKYNNFFGENDTLLKRMLNGICAPIPLIGRPKVSIIMPVFNAEKTLKESLLSACSQTLKDVEIVCINDGSRDDSEKILYDFAKKDNRIRILIQKNQGSGIARNAALLRATGDFISFLDADDLYPNSSTLEVLNTIAEKFKVNVCGGSMSILTNNGSVQTDFSGSISPQKFSFSGISNYDEYQFEYGYQRFIYRRTMLINNGIRFPSYLRFQDPPFMVRAMICAGKFYHMVESTYVYRQGYKKVDWSKEKVSDLICGLTDLLKLSSQYRYSKLHKSILYRFGNDFYQIIHENLKYPEIEELIRNADNWVDKSLLNEVKPSVIKPEIDIQLNAFLRDIQHEFVKPQKDDADFQNTIPVISCDFSEVEKLKRQNFILEQHTAFLRQELSNIQLSISFKLGRTLTFIPRKIRGGIRCYREHGGRYTLHRLKEKLNRIQGR